MNRQYRKTIIAGNWKMNMTASDIKPFMDELKAALPRTKTCETVLCVSAPLIPAALRGAPRPTAISRSRSSKTAAATAPASIRAEGAISVTAVNRKALAEKHGKTALRC